jgi:hypothetical protein
MGELQLAARPFLFPGKKFRFSVILSAVLMAASSAHAVVVFYTLDNVILDDNNAPMYGTFSWTFTEGDFENGVGEFTFLSIPFTNHDHTDLNATFDIGSSIEITLEGSVHDDGVDITLVLEQPLTPTTSSSLELGQVGPPLVVGSKYEIGGNGFHDGSFLSGSIVPIIPVPSVSATGLVALAALLLAAGSRHLAGARPPRSA